MLTRKPMKRTGFKRPEREDKPKPCALLRPILQGVQFGQPKKLPIELPKEKPVRSEKYLRAVASLPCWLCGIEDYSQACHGDEGKGMGIKSSDLTAWPGCAPHDGLPGCHYTIGSTGTYTRDERRILEKQAAQETQLALIEKSINDLKLRNVLESIGLIYDYD